jgi:hypothetical protein
MHVYIVTTNYGVIIRETATCRRIAEVATEDEAYDYCNSIGARIM